MNIAWAPPHLPRFRDYDVGHLLVTSLRPPPIRVDQFGNVDNGKGWTAVRFSSRKWLVGTVAAALTLVIPAGIAWACVTVVQFSTLGPTTVEPGGTVEVFGGDFARGEPVDIRLDSQDGPILATVESPMPSTMTSKFTVQVPIPADVAPGEHILVATQQHYDMNVGIPARASFHVGTSPPAEPLPVERATSLSVSDGPSAARYLLIGLGAAAVGLLVAGAASMIAGRQASSGQAEGARSR